jgi:hypothetical protein
LIVSAGPESVPAGGRGRNGIHTGGHDRHQF